MDVDHSEIGNVNCKDGVIKSGSKVTQNWIQIQWNLNMDTAATNRFVSRCRDTVDLIHLKLKSTFIRLKYLRYKPTGVLLKVVSCFSFMEHEDTII